MINTLVLPSSTSALFLEAKSTRLASTTTCCSVSSRSSGNQLPKLEPFSRSKFDRAVKEPPLIEKSENDLSEYCSTLDGEPSYSCWQAYFELKDLEKETPKADVERLIIQAGGIKTLIGFLHGIAEIHKSKKEKDLISARPKSEASIVDDHGSCPVPDGLPKSQVEVDEEERDKMPDSPFTRLLRNKGKFPAWFSPAPDHETD